MALLPEQLTRQWPLGLKPQFRMPHKSPNPH
jgi:hypothetical protein